MVMCHIVVISGGMDWWKWGDVVDCRFLANIQNQFFLQISN